MFWTRLVWRKLGVVSFGKGHVTCNITASSCPNCYTLPILQPAASRSTLMASCESDALERKIYIFDLLREQFLANGNETKNIYQTDTKRTRFY